MGWKKDTQQLAYDAAEYYYDNILSKGKFPGERNLYRGYSRDDAVKTLAKQYVARLREVIPEKGYNEAMANKVRNLDLASVEKYMFEFGDDPFVATRKGDFERDVIDKWYGWSPKEIEAHMYKFGYDPNKNGDLQKFLEEVRENQTAHDRAKVVNETMEGKDQRSLFPDFLPNTPEWFRRFAFTSTPAMTKEATRQALTGDFDDGKMNRAIAADAVAGVGMGVVPSFGAVFAKPVAAGLLAGGSETARQLIQPTEGSVGDIATAGIAAATVPGIGQYLQGVMGRGASVGSRQLGRQFSRGLRGAADPVQQERTALEKLLKDAKKYSDEAGKKNFFAPGGYQASIPEIERASKWTEAESKLKALGFNPHDVHEELLDAANEAKIGLEVAQSTYDKLMPDKKGNVTVRMTLEDLDKGSAGYQEKLNEYAKKLSYSKDNLESSKKRYAEAMANLEQFENGATNNSVLADASDFASSVEGVIGTDPSRYVGDGISVEYPNDGIKRALGVYDTPPAFYGAVENTPVITSKSVNAYQPMVDRYKAAFPAMYENIALGGDNTKKARLARRAGRIVGGVFGRVEPMLGGNLSALPSGGSYDQKVRNFRETKWYKELSPERKNIIENVLKGGQK